jgi:hypothetical protein
MLAIALGALVMVVWPCVNALHGAQPLRLTVSAAHVAGMRAGYGVVVLVGRMARVPALERGVGADRLSRWHSAGGRAIVGLVIVHVSVSAADGRIDTVGYEYADAGNLARGPAAGGRWLRYVFDFAGRLALRAR